MGFLQLLTSVTTTTSPPSAATDGFALKRGANPGKLLQGFDFTNLEDVICEVWSTAGSAVMTVTIRLWGFSEEAARWLAIGVTPAAGTDTNRGLLNNGVAIAEFAVPADTLAFAQPIGAIKGFSRVAAEVVAIAGTATAVSCLLKNVGA